MTTLNLQVSASLDDAIGAGSTRDGTGAYDATGGPQYLGADYSYFRCAGWRFQNVAIDQGAGDAILSAYLSLCAYETISNAFDLTIHGQAVDNAPAFPASESTNTTSGSPGYRTRTTENYRWYSGSDLTAWTAGNWYTTGNIAPVIRPIINRSGWVKNNSLVLLGLNTGSSLGDYRRKVYTRDQGAAYGAKLDITLQDGAKITLVAQHLLTQGIR